MVLLRKDQLWLNAAACDDHISAAATRRSARGDTMHLIREQLVDDEPFGKLHRLIGTRRYSGQRTVKRRKRENEPRKNEGTHAEQRYAFYE